MGIPCQWECVDGLQRVNLRRLPSVDTKAARAWSRSVGKRRRPRVDHDPLAAVQGLADGGVDFEACSAGSLRAPCRCFEGASGVRTTTGVLSASWVCPVVTTIAAVGRLLLETSTHPRPSTPVTMSLIDRARLSSTMKSLVTPANRTIDSIGATDAWAAESVMMVALAKPPGRSDRRSLGTWVST